MNYRKHNNHFFFIFLIILILASCLSSTESEPEKIESQLQELLNGDYCHVPEHLACDLCSLAIELNNRQKAVQFCEKSYNEGEQPKTRRCGLVSWAYQIMMGRLIEALRLEYQIFEEEPFENGPQIENLLKKSNIQRYLQNSLHKLSQEDAAEPSSEGFLKRAIAHFYLNSTASAQKMLDEAIHVNEKNKSLLIKLKCRIYQNEGKFYEGLQYLNQQISKIEKEHLYLDPYCFHLKGDFLMHHLKFKESIDQFEMANTLYRQKYRAFEHGFAFSVYNIGLSYQKLGAIQSAIEVYKLLIEGGVKHPTVMNSLGSAYVDLALDSGEQIGPQDRQLISKGIFYYESALNVDDKFYLALYNSGFAYLKLNNFQKAVQYFEKTLKVQESENAQYGLASALFSLGNAEKAHEVINSMSLNEESFEKVLFLLYEYSQEKRALELVEQKPDLMKTGASWYWKGMNEYSLEKWNKAVVSFKKAIDSGYTKAHVYFNLAYNQEIMKDFENARLNYGRANQIESRDETQEKVKEMENILKTIRQSNGKANSNEL